MNIGMNMKRIRKIRDMDQKELAKYAGVSPSSISKFEAGKKTPSLSTAVRIAQVLRCTVDELCRNSRQ